MEYTSYRLDTNEPERLRLSGEVTHDVPEDARSTIGWNWKVPVPELEFGSPHHSRDCDLSRDHCFIA
eukprot:8313062-Pyramimonas_sp.AAC.1